MEIEKSSAGWAHQQSDAIQRMLNGGGTPGVVRVEQRADKSGRAILEAMMAGDLPYPPMNDTLNMALLEVGDGRAVFQGIPLPQHYNPLGTLHGGWFATLLDSALGCVVQTTLSAGRSYTTAALSINIVRSASQKTGPLRAVATVVQVGRQMATAEARVEDEKASCTHTQPQPVLSSRHKQLEGKAARNRFSSGRVIEQVAGCRTRQLKRCAPTAMAELCNHSKYGLSFNRSMQKPAAAHHPGSLPIFIG